MQYFEIPIRPAPKQRPRMTKNGRVYTPKPTKVAEHFIRNFIRRCNPTKIDGAISVKAEFIFQRPKTNKNAHHQVRPDLDNLVKLLLDGLQDKYGVFEDDKSIVELHSVKKYGERNMIKLWVKEV